jgi:shikimate kinase
VCLIGFMGAGKTTVGQELARQLQCPFTDLDQEIEAFERASIAEIFSRSGQAAFRQSETETLKRVLANIRKNTVQILAVGGGAFVKKENQEALHQSAATIVFLSAPVDELWQRVNGQKEVERPMLRDRSGFEALLGSRMPHFLTAHRTVETNGRNVSDIAAEIRSILELG